MLRIVTIAALLAVAACGRSNEEQLQEAANQSDPAAAAVLNGAAENGMDPQQALEQAGEAAASSNAVTGAPPSSVQARPNTVQDPNRPAAGQPPEKVATNSN